MTLETGTDPSSERPRSYLFWAIVATLFLCFPAGIVALIYAAGVNPAFDAGDFRKAAQCSESARQWLFFSVLGALLGWLLFGGYSWWAWA